MEEARELTALVMRGLYKQHDVYTKSSENVVIYRIFENVETHLLYVQQCDYLDAEARLKSDPNVSGLMLELFFDEDPSERTDGYKTISEAVDAYVKDFNNA